MGTLGSIWVDVCSKYDNYIYVTLSKMRRQTGQNPFILMTDLTYPVRQEKPQVLWQGF